MAAEDWETESGLLTDYEGTVVDEWFGTDDKYMNGTVMMLFLKMETDQPEYPEYTERYTLGADWQSHDQGKTVEHMKGRKKFIDSTGYGRLLNRISDTTEYPSMQEFYDHVKEDTPRNSEVWHGAKFFFEAEEKNYDIKGEKVKSVKNFPTRFLGIVGITEQLAGDRTNVPNAGSEIERRFPELIEESNVGSLSSSNTGSTAESTGQLYLGDATMETTLRALAKASSDYHGFLSAAMGLPNVVADDRLVVSLSDEATFTSLRS